MSKHGETTTVMFSRSAAIGSGIIRAVSWSSWSHCDLLLPDGRLVGSTPPGGVQYQDFGVRLAHSSHAALMEFPASSSGSAQWAMSQIGKPYDWTGVIGLGFHREWDRDDSWWCSEFVARALMEGGFSPYKPEKIKRLTPQHLWMLHHPVQVLK